MTYLFSSLIAFSLIFVEVSLMPHLISWLAVPFLLLPFISIISIKDRTIFPVLLAGVVGISMDAVSGNVIPIYSIAYVLIAVISKVLLGRFISYGELRANMINMIIGITVIYGTELALNFGNIHDFSWLWMFLVDIACAFLVLIVYIWLGRKYFSWVEKMTEERYR